MIKVFTSKIFFLFFIILFLHENLNAEEESLSQNDLRKKNPFQISIFATTRSPRQNGFVDLHLGYNIRENLTVGISIYTLYPQIISVQGFNRTVLEDYEKKNTQQSANCCL